MNIYFKQTALLTRWMVILIAEVDSEFSNMNYRECQRLDVASDQISYLNRDYHESFHCSLLMFAYIVQNFFKEVLSNTKHQQLYLTTFIVIVFVLSFPLRHYGKRTSRMFILHVFDIPPFILIGFSIAYWTNEGILWWKHTDSQSMSNIYFNALNQIEKSINWYTGRW